MYIEHKLVYSKIDYRMGNAFRGDAPLPGSDKHCFFHSDLSFGCRKDSCFAEVVNSLLTAPSVGTVLLAEGGRRLFLKKTSASESLSELRLVWTWGSEKRALGLCKALKTGLWPSWSMCFVQNCHVAAHGILLASWPRPGDEYVTANPTSYQGDQAQESLEVWWIQLFSFFICVSFSFQTCHRQRSQFHFLPLPLSLDSCLLLCSGSCGALLACTSFSSGPCLVVGDPSRRAGCALVTI